MITPRAVRADRILFRRRAPKAVRNVEGKRRRPRGAAIAAASPSSGRGRLTACRRCRPDVGQSSAIAAAALASPPLAATAASLPMPAVRHADDRVAAPVPASARQCRRAAAAMRQVGGAMAARTDAGRGGMLVTTRRAISSPSIRPSAMRIVRWA